MFPCPHCSKMIEVGPVSKNIFGQYDPGATRVSLGCGTLILIAIIVAMFSGRGTPKGTSGRSCGAGFTIPQYAEVGASPRTMRSARSVPGLPCRSTRLDCPGSHATRVSRRPGSRHLRRAIRPRWPEPLRGRGASPYRCPVSRSDRMSSRRHR